MRRAAQARGGRGEGSLRATELLRALRQRRCSHSRCHCVFRRVFRGEADAVQRLHSGPARVPRWRVSSRCDAPGVWNGGRGGGWTVTAGWTGVSSMTHVSGGTGHPRRTLRLRRLRGIGPQQAIFQRCAIESADDRVHFVRVRRFDEREALGLLRFRIADHFNRVRDQVLGASQPLISSAVTQAGRLPRKTVKLIQRLSSTPAVGDLLPGGLP